MIRQEDNVPTPDRFLARPITGIKDRLGLQDLQDRLIESKLLQSQDKLRSAK